MNPFTIGQTLTVQFGTRQWWCVERVTDTHCAMRYPGLTCPAVKWFRVDDLRTWNPVVTENHYKRMQQLVAGDTVFLAGAIGAWCVVLWIDAPYEARVWPNAPAHVTECTRTSILRNTQTGQHLIYPFRDATAEGRLRVQEAS